MGYEVQTGTHAYTNAGFTCQDFCVTDETDAGLR